MRHVLRLDVSMRHPEAVHVVERSGQLRGDRRRQRLGQPAPVVHVWVGLDLHIPVQRASCEGSARWGGGARVPRCLSDGKKHSAWGVSRLAGGQPQPHH